MICITISIDDNTMNIYTPFIVVPVQNVGIELRSRALFFTT